MRKVRGRLRERDFWFIQIGLVAITLIHLVYEGAAEASHDGTFYEAMHHVPATLYVVPVAYAGLVYGLEGGMLTGVASLVLTVPNLVLWHRTSYAWAGELSFMVIVVTIGTGLAVPAARERRHRREAERTARELSLVNAVATAIVSSQDLEATVEHALGIVVQGLDLDGACVGLWRRDDPHPVVVSCTLDEQDARARLQRAIRDEIRPEIGVGPLELADGVVGVPLSAVGLSGALAVLPPHGRRMNADDAQLLRAVGNQIVVAVDNLALHREEQEHLRSYVRLATQAQEEERLRIAREIHDETAQLLALIRRGLRDLSKRANGDLVAGPLGLAELTELSEASLQSLRKFARDLRPDTLDNLGLVPALRWLAGNLGRRAGVNTTVVVEGEPRRVAPEAEVALFRMVQEALRNVERHAEAHSTSMRVNYDLDAVRVEVRDDGRGFSIPTRLSEFPMTGKLGLVGMQERARLAGGSVDVQSRPGHGTLVAVTLPVPDETSARRPPSAVPHGQSRAERPFGPSEQEVRAIGEVEEDVGREAHGQREPGADEQGQS